MNAFPEYWELIEKAQKTIEALEAQYGNRAQDLQRQLMSFLNRELVDKMETEKGLVVSSAKNWQVLRDFDRVWAAYTAEVLQPAMIQFANDLVGVTALSQGYFSMILSDTVAAPAFQTARNNILQMLGMTLSEAGNLEIQAGGYIDRLVRSEEMSRQIRALIRDNITVGSSYKDFYRNFRTLVVGSDEVNGAMQKYFRTYVYDAFSAVQAAFDNVVAAETGMTKFIYAGTLIRDSRPFCVEHVNHIYDRDDIPRFEKMDWAGKNKTAPFIIARGGYNCRHQLAWISDEIAAGLVDGDNNTDPQPDENVAKNFDEAKEKFDMADLTFDERIAVHSFQGTGYRRMNEMLRDGVIDLEQVPGTLSEEAKNSVLHMRTAIAKSTKFKGTIYRGIGLSQHNYDNLLAQLKDGYYMDKGFGSFTTNEQFGIKWMLGKESQGKRPVFFTCKAQGKNGAYLGNAEEWEINFMDSTRFKATYEIRTMEFYDGNTKEYLEITLEEI